MKNKINLNALFISSAIFLLVIQVIIQSYIGIFQYYDEIFTMFCMLYFGGEIIKNFRNSMMVDILFIIILIFIGIGGNVIYGIQENVSAILTDIGNVFKAFITFYGFYQFFSRYKMADLNKYIIQYLNMYSKILVLPGALLAIVNLFINVGMHTEYVHNLQAFHYIFLRVNNLNAACMIILIIMTARLQDLDEVHRKVQYHFIIMTLILMLSTLRSRAFLYTVVYITFYLFFIKGKRIRIRSVICILALVTAISFPKLKFYFLNSTTARSVLLQNGYKTAVRCFPIGAGFGSYGTFAAKKYWSILYDEYEFSKYYGLSRAWGAFLTDSYWPAIMGEFGFIGVLIVIILIVRIFLKVIKATHGQPITRFSALFGITCISIASMVDSSFFHTTSVAIMSLVALTATCRITNADDHKPNHSIVEKIYKLGE